MCQVAEKSTEAIAHSPGSSKGDQGAAWSIDLGHRCCLMLSIVPRVSTESCYVEMKTCPERKRNVL